jgi:Predicted Fe-S oxidoreductase
LVEKQIWGIKLHMLHILKNTDLESYYKIHPFDIMEPDAYISLICDLISIIPEEIVIHRLTGDGSKEDLIAPLWSANKRYILNGINKELAKRNLTQGCNL